MRTISETAGLTTSGLERVLDSALGQTEVDELAAALAAGLPGVAAQDAARLLQRLSILMEVHRTIGATLALDQLLPRLIELITKLLEADRGTLFLHDPASNELFSRVLQGGTVAEIRIPSHAGIAGHVFSHAETLNIPDAYTDPRFNPEVDRRTGYRTRNILCAPLLNRDRQVIGVTQLLNRREGAFTEADATLLQVITTQAAAALEHAQLFERLEQARADEQALLEVSAAVAGDLDIDALLIKVMGATTRLLDAERSTLFIHDPATDELWSRVAEGADAFRIPSHAGIAGESFTAGEVLNIPDAYADPRFNQEVDRRTGFRTRSILCMPLANKLGERIAVMQVLNKRGGPFSARDEARLRAFTAQVSVALENARLFRDVLDLKNYNEGILKSLTNGVVTIDPDNAISKVNDAALLLLGRDADEVVGWQAEQLFGNHNPWIISSLDYVASTGGSDYHADTDFHRDGENVTAVNLTVAPLRGVDDRHMGSMLVFEDITSEKRFRSTMARYLAKEVVDKIVSQGGEALAAQAQEATVLFSDIRRFTTIAEQIGARRTVEMLNAYFTDMVEVVLRHNGLLDKYIGDAIMAVFGAPVVSPRDADNAVSVAVEMLQALHQFNHRRRRDGSDDIAIGIGVASGEVIAGSVGSTKRMDYTVIGDTVNLAARLEGANKYFGTSVLLAESTVALLSAPPALRVIDRIRVKGKDTPLEVFEPLTYHEPERLSQLYTALPTYERAMALYRNRQWRDATEGFAEALATVPGDGPAAHYIDRCRYYGGQPPPDDWDGVWQLHEK